MAALIFIMAIPLAIYLGFELYDAVIKKALGYSKKAKSVPTETQA